MSVNTNKSSQMIPEGGTLGILAYGYQGVMLWRQERFKIAEKRSNNQFNKKTNHEES